MSVGYLPAGVYDDREENGADYEWSILPVAPIITGMCLLDAMITIDSIEIRLQTPGTVQLEALYMSKLASDDVPSPIPSSSSTDSTESTDGTTGSTDASQSTEPSSLDRQLHD